MVKVEKIYMTGCVPCMQADEILKDLKQTKDFELHEYNITDGDFKERKNGKILLARWGTKKVPLLLFSVNNEVKKVLYGGIQEINKEIIENILIELNGESKGVEEEA